MKVGVHKIGLNFLAVQTKEPETGVQNTITANHVIFHRNEMSGGFPVFDGIYEVDAVELSVIELEVGKEFVVLLKNGAILEHKNLSSSSTVKETKE